MSTSLITSLSTYIHTCISVSTNETVNEIKEIIVKNGLPISTTITLPVAATANVSSIYTVYDAPKPGRENHPLIKFWYKRDYLQVENVKKKTAAVLDPALAKQPAPRGSTRLAHGNENVATDYIEMEDGEIVSGSTAQSIRSTLRNILKEVKEAEDMSLAEVWKDIGQNERKFILNKLYTKFPYIRLCDNDWKACFLASHVLTNMKHSEKRRQMRMSVKTEHNAASDVEDSKAGLVEAILDSSAGLKRKLSFSFDSEPEPAKCGRTDSIPSILPSDPAEPIVEIHDATDQPMPPASTSTQVQPLGHNLDLRQTVSAIYSPDTTRPRLVQRLPPRDPSIQCSIPSLELIDMEPRPQNPNLVRRVKRVPTFESVNTASTLSMIQPPTITVHSSTVAIQPITIAIQLSDMETQVDETQSLAVAAAAEVDETQSPVPVADVERNVAIANPLFVDSRCRKLQ